MLGRVVLFSMDSWKFIFFCRIKSNVTIFFVAQIVLIWTLGVLSGWFRCLFIRSTSHLPKLLLSTLLLSGTWKCFMYTQKIVYFLWPVLESTGSPRSFSSFYCRVVFRNQDLARCPHLLLSPFSRQSLEICIWCTHTHTFHFLKISPELMLIPLVQIQHCRAHSSFLPFLIFNFLWREKPGSHNLQYVDLIVQLVYTHKAFSE